MPSSASISASLRPGLLLGGKYRTERMLGQGGMGVVVAARHLELDTPVAIKLLRADLMNDAETVGRFMREAQAASKLRSDHAVRVTDVGRLESGQPFMVMELLDGEDLDDVLARAGAMPIAQAVDCILQACEALAEAHAHGLVHRDIKPSNLFLTRRIDGRPLVKVLDFGIAKATAPLGADGVATTTKTMVGSPLYMSPEQMRTSKTIDHRTDIWSLGVCLYELLAAQPPFAAESLPEVCSKVMTGWVTPIDEVRPDVPQTLARIVMHCLAKEAGDRFQDVGELSRALESFASLSSRGSGDRISAVLASAPRIRLAESSVPKLNVDPLGETGAAKPFATTSRPGVSHAGLAIALAGAVGLAVVAVGAFVIARHRLDTRIASHAASSASLPMDILAEHADIRVEAPPTGEARPAPPRTSTPSASARPRASAHPTTTLATASLLPPPPPVVPSPEPPPTPIATMSPPGPTAEPPAPPPAPSPPPPPFDPSRGRVRWSVADAGGGATGGNVAHALAHASGSWNACYQAGLRARGAPVEGNATLQLTCDDSGLVVDGRLSGVDLPGLAACVRAAAVGSRIPNADTGTAWATVTLSLQIEK